MQSTPLSRRSGFTLLELLVVIAIIGILAAIFLGVSSKLRASAARTQSASNLRQLATAVTNYANDNNGQYPPSTINYLMSSYVAAPDNLQGWAAVYEYLGEPRPASQTDLSKKRVKVLYVNTPGSKQFLDPNFAVTDYTLWTNAQNVSGGDDNIPKRTIGGTLLKWPLITDNACSVGVTFQNPKNGAVVGMNSAFADGSIRWSRGNDAGANSEVNWVTAGYAGVVHAIPKP
jgi:prepilin-type N-terminal cleavage/methylation domain-containing protein